MMIRKAAWKDIDAVENLYTDILLYEQAHGAYTVWALGVYPTRNTAEKSFSEGSLYVLEKDGTICASMIVNQVQPPEYEAIHWKHPAKPEEVFVLHLLCVSPSHARLGLGKQMVHFVMEEAKQKKGKTIRLDTGSQNIPAVALYNHLGFELAETTHMAIGGLIAHANHLFFERPI